MIQLIERLYVKKKRFCHVHEYGYQHFIISVGVQLLMKTIMKSRWHKAIKTYMMPGLRYIIITSMYVNITQTIFCDAMILYLKFENDM